VLDKESTVIKIGSASYIMPIINLISDRMWKYWQKYLRQQAQTIIFLFVLVELIPVVSNTIYQGIQSD
jgi:Fe2+ transport system protein B